MADKFILLVEDNEDDVALTEMAFKKSGIPNKLVLARDGQEALDILFSKYGKSDGEVKTLPALILLDLKLPFVSGLDVLKEVKASNKTSQIPVIVLTSSMEDNDRIESYRLGANDYIRKPTGFHQFVEIIQKIKNNWLNSNGENLQFNLHPSGFGLFKLQSEDFFEKSFTF